MYVVDSKMCQKTISSVPDFRKCVCVVHGKRSPKEERGPTFTKPQAPSHSVLHSGSPFVLLYILRCFYFLFKFCSALMNVLGSMWSNRMFLNLQCNKVNERESDFMVY